MDTLVLRSLRAAHRDILVLTLSEENYTKFAGNLHWGVRFSGTEMASGGHFFEKLYTFFYWLLVIGRRLNLFIADMYNRYTCLLQPYRHLTLKLLIQGHPRSAKVTHIADFKSVYISLIIGPRGLQCETNLQEIMCCEFSDVV